MPSDLRPTPSNPRARPRGAAPPLTPLRVFLVCFVATLYALAAVRFSLPPHSWIESYVHKHWDLGDKVVKHRPAFRHIERYSPEHRYRPATSPVVTQIGKDGKPKYIGKYH
ncbi:hypothetical protein JCM5296_000321 [Sporobolomyces johnsonii]